MKLTFRMVAIATATAAVAVLFSPGWSKQDGVLLSISKAHVLNRAVSVSISGPPGMKTRFRIPLPVRRNEARLRAHETARAAREIRSPHLGRRVL